MADTEQLVLSISADVRQMQRALDRMTKDTAQTTRKIEGHFDRMGKNVNKSLGAIGAFAKGGLAGIAAGFSLQEAKQLLDVNTRMTNALKVAGLEGAKLTKVYDQLFATAQKNGAPIESLVNLYSKLSLSQKELGVSSDDLVKFADSIGVALRVSGTSAEQASGALLQLSQALGGGVVRAEEFNSILEGAPGIARAAAIGIQQAEGSVAKLRQLMIDGAISSKAFFDGIQAGAPVLEQSLGGAATTIDQAMTKVGNALVKVVGEFDKTTGTSEKLADFLSGPLTQALNEIPKAFQPLIDILDFTSQAMDRLLQMSADIGEMTGLSQIGAAAGATPYIGPGRAQFRVNQAFGGMPAYSTPKTGRLPYSFATGKPKPVEGAVDLTKPEYAVADSAKKTKVALTDLEKAAKKAADAFNASSLELTTNVLKHFEGFSATPYFDVNALRAGFGSDTITLSDGTVKAVTAGVRVSVEQGNRDLVRRIGEFQDIIRKQIGAGTFGQMNEQQQAALTSIAYNYGSLPDRIVDAIKTGSSATVEAAIRGLAPDNAGVNAGRRNLEADLFAGQQVSILSDQYDAAADSTRNFNDAQRELAETMRADVADAASSALGGFIQDLIDGKDATEALGNALGQLADDLINIGLQGILGSGSAGTGIAGAIAAALGGGGAMTGLYHTGGTAGSAINSRTVPALAFVGAQRYHSGGMAGIRPGEVPAILQRGEMVLPKGARMGGSSIVVNNYSKAEVQAREQPAGKGFEVIIEERIADRINTRGTPANRAVRSAASNQLRKL